MASVASFNFVIGRINQTANGNVTKHMNAPIPMTTPIVIFRSLLAGPLKTELD